MNTREIIQKIDYILHTLGRVEIKQDDEKTIINNVQALNMAMTAILELKILTSKITGLLKIIEGNKVYENEINNVSSVRKEIYAHLDNGFNEVSHALSEIKLMLTNTLPKDTKESIIISIPNDKDFRGLSQLYNNLEKIFSALSESKEIGLKVSILGASNGSTLLHIALGAAPALLALAKLINSAAMAYKTIQEGQVFKQQARALKLENDLKNSDAIDKRIKEKVDEIIKSKAENISKEINIEIGEGSRKIEDAINRLEQLFEGGIQIIPSLETPEEVKELMPDIKDWKNIQEKKIKILSEKNKRERKKEE